MNVCVYECVCAYMNVCMNVCARMYMFKEMIEDILINQLNVSENEFAPTTQWFVEYASLWKKCYDNIMVSLVSTRYNFTKRQRSNIFNCFRFCFSVEAFTKRSFN